LLRPASWHLSFPADSRGKNAQRVADLRWAHERFLLYFPEVTLGFPEEQASETAWSSRPLEAASAFRVLPMNLRRGDVLTDEISEWRVIMRRL